MFGNKIKNIFSNLNKKRFYLFLLYIVTLFILLYSFLIYQKIRNLNQNIFKIINLENSLDKIGKGVNDSFVIVKKDVAIRRIKEGRENFKRNIILFKTTYENIFFKKVESEWRNFKKIINNYLKLDKYDINNPITLVLNSKINKHIEDLKKIVTSYKKSKTKQGQLKERFLAFIWIVYILFCFLVIGLLYRIVHTDSLFIKKINTCNSVSQILDILCQHLTRKNFWGYFIMLEGEHDDYICEKIKLKPSLKEMEDVLTNWSIKNKNFKKIIDYFTQTNAYFLHVSDHNREKFDEIFKYQFNMWNIKHYLVIPIKQSQNIIGFIMIINYKKHNLFWINEIIKKVQSFYYPLYNSLIFSRLKSKEQEIKQIYQRNFKVIDILSRINNLTNINSIYRIIVEEILSLYEFNVGGLYILQKDILVLDNYFALNSKFQPIVDEILALDLKERSYGVDLNEGAISISYIQNSHFYINDVDKIKNLPMSKKDKNFINLLKGIHSHLIMPIRKSNQIIGVLTISNLEKKVNLDQSELKTIESICSFISTAIENSELYSIIENQKKEIETKNNELSFKNLLITEDIMMAKNIQENLLPKLNQFNKKLINFFIHYQPQSQIGGDLYDIHKLDDGLVRVFIADATGHGVQAAMTTMLIKSEYEKIKNFPYSVNKLLKILNKAFIKQYYNLNVFFSCLVIDIDKKNKTTKYSSAGHPTQYIISNNKLKNLNSGGKLIGLLDKVDYKIFSLKIEKGDKILLFTDGLIEERSNEGQILSEDDFLNMIKSHKEKPIQELGQSIINELFNYMGDQPVDDDITLIGIEIK